MRDQGTFKTGFGCPLPPLIVKQTPTALLVGGQRDSFETGHRLHPTPSSIMAAPASEDFTPLPGTHDRSNVVTGECRDMYALRFLTICSVEKLSAYSSPSKCSLEPGP